MMISSGAFAYGLLARCILANDARYMCINRATAFVKISGMTRVELLHRQAGVAASVRLWLLARHNLTSGMRFGVLRSGIIFSISVEAP